MNTRDTCLAVLAVLTMSATTHAQLVLNIDQSTGAVEILNTSDTVAVQINGYELRSAQDGGASDDGLLDAAGWADLETSIGNGWMATDFPSSEVLLETNANSVLSIAPGASQSLGSAFTTNAATLSAAKSLAGFGEEYRDVTFKYNDFDNGSAVVSGSVNYLNPIFNDLVLSVDRSTGAAELVNESPIAITIEAYILSSLDGSLDTNWNGLSDSVANWGMNVGTANALAEASDLDPGSNPGEPLAPLEILGGASYQLGTAYQPGFDEDIVFTYLPVGDAEGRAGIVRYTGTAVLRGDYNGDGTVDAADYAFWRNNLDQPESVLQSPGDGSGTVDAGDYTVWRSNYGRTDNAPQPSAVSSSVAPEPGALVSLTFAIAIGAIGRRR